MDKGKKHVDKGVIELDAQRDYIADIRFTNTLPDIPFSPKFLYRQKNIKGAFDHTTKAFLSKHERPFLTEVDGGVYVELIDRDLYKPSKNSEVHWKDAFLLEEEKHVSKEKSRSETHSTPVSFMRKKHTRVKHSRYLASSAGRVETKIGYNLEKKGDVEIYQTREMQIEAIEKTFEDVKNPCTEHYAKKDVFAVDEFPILPDFKHFGFSLVPVEFTAYPDIPNVREDLRMDTLAYSHLANTGVSSGHFLPTVDTVENLLKSIELDSDEEDFSIEYKYTLDREYSYVQKRCPEEYYFCFDEELVMYSPLAEEKVVLSRVRNPTDRRQHPVELHLHHRAKTKKEVAELTMKMKRLLTKSDKMEFEKEAEPEEHYAIPGQRYEEVEDADVSSSDLSSASDSSDEYQPPTHGESHHRKVNSSDEDEDDDVGKDIMYRSIQIKQEPESSSSYHSSDSS